MVRRYSKNCRRYCRE